MASLINEEDGSSKLFSNSHIRYKLSVIFYESCHMIHMVKGFDGIRAFSETTQSFILARHVDVRSSPQRCSLQTTTFSVHVPDRPNPLVTGLSTTNEMICMQKFYDVIRSSSFENFNF